MFFWKKEKNNNDKSEYKKLEETVSEVINDVEDLKTEIKDIKSEIESLRIFNNDICSKIEEIFNVESNLDSEIKEMQSTIKNIKDIIADNKRLYMNESDKKRSGKKRMKKLTKEEQEDRYMHFKQFWLNNPELAKTRAYNECGLPSTNSTRVYINRRMAEDNLRRRIYRKKKTTKI
jgi:regulator of replication initiation timing